MIQTAFRSSSRLVLAAPAETKQLPLSTLTILLKKNLSLKTARTMSTSSDRTSDILARVHELVQQSGINSEHLDHTTKVVNFEHPEELIKKLPVDIGREGVDNDHLEEVCKTVIEYSVKTCHPHFYNQLYHGVDQFGLAGSWLSDALNTNNHTFEVSPTFIMIEHYILSYIRQLFGWGDQGDGIFSPGGSMSNMYGMMLARHAKFPNLKSTGLFGHKPLVAFTSDESHYSIVKGANWLGLGVDNVVKIPTDEGGRMIAEELEALIVKAKEDGKEPFFVNATSGSTVLGAYDDLEKMADVCARQQVWLHVDACWGGSAILSKKYKHLMRGSDKVDSIAWNPHKMVGAPLQCSPFIVRHKGALHQCNSANATYLFQQDKFYDVTYDTGDKSVQCGRKVDAFKLWFMIKARGEAYLDEAVENTFAMADHLTQLVVDREGFRLVPAYQNRKCTNVGFWYIPPRLRGLEEDEAWWEEVGKIAPSIKEAMIMEGSLMIGYQPMPHRGLHNFFRMVIHSCPRPTKEHMQFIVDRIDAIGKDL